MSVKTDSRTIDGIDFKCSQLPAMRSFGLLARLGKLLAPVLGSAGHVTMKSDIKELLPAVAELFKTLDGVEAQSLAREVLSSTTAVIGGKAITLNTDDMINMAFSGKMKTMISAIKFSLEVNYSDFLADLPLATATLGEGEAEAEKE